MTKRLETSRDFAGRTAILAAKIQEHYSLSEPPQLVFHESEGWIELPDLPDIVTFVATTDLTPVGGEWKLRAAELLDKDKLTAKEDEELKQLHRKMFRESLRGLG